MNCTVLHIKKIWKCELVKKWVLLNSNHFHGHIVFSYRFELKLTTCIFLGIDYTMEVVLSANNIMLYL